jgi:hypothetical protein
VCDFGFNLCAESHLKVIFILVNISLTIYTDNRWSKNLEGRAAKFLGSRFIRPFFRKAAPKITKFAYDLIWSVAKERTTGGMGVYYVTKEEKELYDAGGTPGYSLVQPLPEVTIIGNEKEGSDEEK